MADARGLGPRGETLAGSSPVSPTNLGRHEPLSRPLSLPPPPPRPRPRPRPRRPGSGRPNREFFGFGKFFASKFFTSQLSVLLQPGHSRRKSATKFRTKLT